MLKTRVIPSLLMMNGGLVKTVRFNRPKYVGDPINAIKIFNDKEADELMILDITASKNQRIDYDLLGRINKEAFMPLGYGGGIKSIEDIKRILQLGFEKVVCNSAFLDRPEFVKEAAYACGSQSVVCCIDIKRNLLGQAMVFDYRKKKSTKLKAIEWAMRCEMLGAGELLLYSVDNDGTFSGYDLIGLREITDNVRIPVVALGGAGTVADFKRAITDGGASAVSAGSMFVFHGPHKAVLITYPSKDTIIKEFLQ